MLDGEESLQEKYDYVKKKDENLTLFIDMPVVFMRLNK